MITDPALKPDIDAIESPLRYTPVLLNRKIHPDTDPATLTVFGDDRWELTPGLFESHAPTVGLNFRALPEPFREPVKHYVWQLINHDAPRRLRDTDAARLALRSIVLLYPRFTAFVIWLDSHGISRFAAVTADHLDHYLADVVACEASANMKASRLMEVRRFWSYRSRLPETMRLQVPPPWDGEEPRDLLDASRRSAYNRTPRIQTDTIEMLLMWSLRFVETFADDITNAFHEHLELWPYSAVVCDPKFPSPKRRSANDVRPELLDYLDHLRMTGLSLRAASTLAARCRSIGPIWCGCSRLMRQCLRSVSPCAHLSNNPGCRSAIDSHSRPQSRPPSAKSPGSQGHSATARRGTWRGGCALRASW